MFYTYLWRDASGVPFYVGKGKDRRAYEMRGRSPEFLAIHSQGGCAVEIVDEFILESQAHAHEMELIARYGRRDPGTGLLVNKTDGGEGVSGCYPNAETLRKMRAAQTGKTLSPETRAKISAARSGSRASVDTRARMSASRTGKKQSAEHIKSSAGARRGKTRAAGFGNLIRSTLIASPPRRGKYKGVCFNGDVRRWQARIQTPDGRKFLGYFGSDEDAARAYDAAASALWGGACYLNFPAVADA